MLYVVEALVFAVLALIAHDGFVLVPVLVLGLFDGALALTARALTRGAVAERGPAVRPAEGGQRAAEHRLRGRPPSAARHSVAC